MMVVDEKCCKVLSIFDKYFYKNIDNLFQKYQSYVDAILDKNETKIDSTFSNFVLHFDSPTAYNASNHPSAPPG